VLISVASFSRGGREFSATTRHSALWRGVGSGSCALKSCVLTHFRGPTRRQGRPAAGPDAVRKRRGGARPVKPEGTLGGFTPRTVSDSPRGSAVPLIQGARLFFPGPSISAIKALAPPRANLGRRWLRKTRSPGFGGRAPRCLGQVLGEARAPTVGARRRSPPATGLGQRAGWRHAEQATAVLAAPPGGSANGPQAHPGNNASADAGFSAARTSRGGGQRRRAEPEGQAGQLLGLYALEFSARRRRRPGARGMGVARYVRFTHIDNMSGTPNGVTATPRYSKEKIRLARKIGYDIVLSEIVESANMSQAAAPFAWLALPAARPHGTLTTDRRRTRRTSDLDHVRDPNGPGQPQPTAKAARSSPKLGHGPYGARPTHAHPVVLRKTVERPEATSPAAPAPGGGTAGSGADRN